MEYTIQKLAGIAGISTRAIRFYDEIGLLKPARINSSGYRIYGQTETDRLQQILFYRELDVPLEQIKTIIDHPMFSGSEALQAHREQLLARRKQIDQLIINVDQSIAASKGEIKMNDKDKFNGFKSKMISDNETRYGKEARQRYGDDAVDRSNQKVKGMTEAQYAEATKLAEAVMTTLRQAFATGDPTGKLAQKAADLHRQWLSFYWDQYSPEAHAGLAQMYVDDDRFTAFYDQDQPGTTIFLRDAILVYTKTAQR
jgi:DNA-binding transcriptional MerR regulator